MSKKISVKKFLKILLFITIIFLSYHLTVWQFYTSKIFNHPTNSGVGDLGRMSYQVDFLQKRKVENTLKKQHINKLNWNNQKIDIITLGDSFSNGAGSGLNAYYQDYLASKYKLNILNIHDAKNYTNLETIIGLYDGGILDKIKPKAIIIQSVERNIIEKYSKTIRIKKPIQIIESLIANKVKGIPVPNILKINTANYKLPFYLVKYKYKDNAIKSVYKLNLTKKLFSSKIESEILFYGDDIKNINQFTIKKITKVNDNFNKLARKLKKLNIKLYFMPVTDKYDLYYDFIKNNKYPKNNFFEIIRPMKKEYYFIDTKAILLPLLNSGVKDIYYADDTHWSYKASETIIKDKLFNDNF